MAPDISPPASPTTGNRMTLPPHPHTHPREPRPAAYEVPFPPDYLERVYAGVLG